MRRFGSALFVFGVAFAVGGQLVSAEPGVPGSEWHPALPQRSGLRRVAVPTTASSFVHRDHSGSSKAVASSQISPYLYLNRCTGGCTVTGGVANDAMLNQSSIPPPGSHTVGEFANAFGQLGSAGTCLVCPDSSHLGCNPGVQAGSSMATTCVADTDCTTAFPSKNAYCDSANADWAAFLTCMKEVDSPYALTVSDTVPPGGASYTEGMIAGLPGDVGEPNDVLGIAPILCNMPQDNAISFSFANYHTGYGEDRALAICWTAAQETSHVWGLDHEYQYSSNVLTGTDGDSACNDPMTYRTDCGGQKFYRNESAFIGTYGKGTGVVCRPTQNSHSMVLAVFGPGQSTAAPLTSTIVFPSTGATVSQAFAVDADAGGPFNSRGVWTIDLWLNGYRWSTQPGAQFGSGPGGGQANPSTYTFTTPNSLPMGAYDIVVKAYDDLGAEADSPPISVMYGTGCTADSQCAKGQHCNTTTADNGMAPPGGCYWDAPTGQLGDKCTYPQFCVSGICDGTAQDTICTQSCTVGVDSPCPGTLDCVPTGGSASTAGVCFPAGGGGGCCSASGRDAVWVQGGLSALVLGFMFRRRRRA
jgi:hypothetical protein